MTIVTTLKKKMTNKPKIRDILVALKGNNSSSIKIHILIIVRWCSIKDTIIVGL